MKFRLFILCLLVSLISYGQNTTRFSQLNFSQGVNNPAAIAIDGRIMLDMIFRNQWAGVEGAPTTVAMNAQYELNANNAVGLNIYYDQIGVNKTTSLAGQYAYRIRFDQNRFFSLGLGLGMDNTISSLGSSIVNDPNDPAFAASYSKVLFNGSLGIMYNSPKFYIGASIPQLFQNTPVGTERWFQPSRWHYYVSSGFYFPNAKGNYTFNPHLQVKATANAPLQADLILRNTFINRWSLVVGYRSEHSVVAGFDILLGGYCRVGYSFNIDVGKLSRFKGISNELYLGLAFPYHNDREAATSRRYISSKGAYKRDYSKSSRRKHQRRGQRWGRNKKYR